MRTLVLSTLFIGFFSASAFATPIEYIESGIGSGSFAGQQFSQQQITLTFRGDTNTIDNFDPIYQNATGSAQVTVAGLGSGSIDGAYVYANHANSPASAGIADYASGTTIMGTLDSGFSTYQLDLINPISSTGAFNANVSFTTSAGGFLITSLGSTTFSAIQVSAVPLPASLPLFAAALFGLGLVARGRHSKGIDAKAM